MPTTPELRQFWLAVLEQEFERLRHERTHACRERLIH
jgi:hypothetical protein